MTCLDDSLLQRFVEGALDGPEEELVRAHLSGCRACRGQVAGYKQLMWDLEHPDEPEIPQELDELHAALVGAWNEQQSEQRQPGRSARSLIPAWAGYTVLWARHVPAVELVGGLISRAGSRLLASRLPFYRRRGRRG